jgi:adenine-specific DNA methylase
MSYRKKLMEVDLPLDAINKASIREKSIRHVHLARTLQKAVGHPCPPFT